MSKKMKHLIAVALILIFTLALTVSASAEELESEVTEDAEDVNIFGKIYSELSGYAGEILCAMTFVGSLALAIAYKRGLLPIVRGSLLTIGNAVSKMKDSVSENAEKGEVLGKSIEGGLESAKAVLDSLAVKIGDLESTLAKQLTSENEAAKEKEALKLVLISQIDMLRDIFMSASLPQYQKDAIGERIAKMKEALGKNGTEN